MAQSNVVSDVGQSSGGLGTAVAAAIVQFNKAAVMPSLITMSAAPAGTTTVRFPVYTKHDVTHADYGVKNMADAAEDTIANLTNIETTAVDCKVLRNAIRAEITDLAAYGNADALLTNAGRQLGNDIAREFDVDICALLDGFGTAVGHDDGMNFNLFMDAIANLEANDAPRPYAAVFHPQQIYGSQGLSTEFGSVAAVNSSNGAFAGMTGAAEAQFMGAGFVTSLAGVNIFTTTAVPDGATGRKRGGMFARTALGCGYIDFGGGNFIQMASEREEAYAKTTLVANGYWEAAELVDVHGVEIDTEIS